VVDINSSMRSTACSWCGPPVADEFPAGGLRNCFMNNRTLQANRVYKGRRKRKDRKKRKEARSPNCPGRKPCPVRPARCQRWVVGQTEGEGNEE